MAKKEESSELVPTEKGDQTLTYVKWGLMGVGGLVVLSWVLKILLNPFFLIPIVLLAGGGWWMMKGKREDEVTGDSAGESAKSTSRSTSSRSSRAPEPEDALSEFDRRLAELERLKNDPKR